MQGLVDVKRILNAWYSEHRTHKPPDSEAYKQWKEEQKAKRRTASAKAGAGLQGRKPSDVFTMPKANPVVRPRAEGQKTPGAGAGKKRALNYNLYKLH